MPQRLVRRGEGPRAGGDLQCRGEGCVVFRVKIKETHGAERTSRGGRGSCPDRRRETKVLSSLTTAVGAVPRAGFDRGLWDVNSRWRRACGRSYALGLLKPAVLRWALCAVRSRVPSVTSAATTPAETLTQTSAFGKHLSTCSLPAVAVGLGCLAWERCWQRRSRLNHRAFRVA